jgi:hypothetical protein
MKKIVISEKQLNDLVGKLNESDKGSSMTKQQLFTIATLAHKMWESMEDDEEIEDWMVSKVAQAEQSIITVVKSYMYNEFVDEKQTDGMGKLNFDELIIGK